MVKFHANTEERRKNCYATNYIKHCYQIIEGFSCVTYRFVNLKIHFEKFSVGIEFYDQTH